MLNQQMLLAAFLIKVTINFHNNNNRGMVINNHERTLDAKEHCSRGRQ